MPVIPLGTDDWQSASENIPRIKLHNMYIAEDPASPDGKTRVSRPTLKSWLTLPSGPCKGAYLLDGALNGAGTLGLMVAGTKLYGVDPISVHSFEIGNIPGTGYCQFAGVTDRVLILRDGIVYSVDNSFNITLVTIPDSLLIGSIASIDGYFLLSVASSNKFYWIIPGGTNPDPLDFASAERYPDPIVSIGVVNDEIWFIGTKGPEVWQVTGDNDAPFERIPARDYSEGCASNFTTVSVNYQDIPALIWVTSQGAVTMAQGKTNRISNESVEELLRGASYSSLRAYAFRYNRHDFYVLTDTTFTLVYDLTVGNWARWDSYGQDIFRAHLGFQYQNKVLCGDVTTNDIWLLEEGSTDTDANDPVVREVSGGIFNTGKPYQCTDVIVRVNAGWTESYTDEPQLEMRFSDDQGATWSSYQQGVGLRGQYLTDVIFRSLGLIVRPGRLFEFRFTEPTRIRIDYATINEANT